VFGQFLAEHKIEKFS